MTNTQAVPELTTSLDDNLAMSPDLHFEPNLTIQQIHLANCSQDTLALYPDTIILSLQFHTEQIIGIKRKINDILNTQLMDANIINFRFLENTASCISKLAVNSYIKDLQTYRVKIKKRDKQIKPLENHQENHAQQDTQQLPEKQQSIFKLDNRNKNIVLQTTTLLQGLLKQGFPAKHDQLLQLQISDLQIRDIYDDVISGTSDGFVLVHKILYKKSRNRGC